LLKQQPLILITGAARCGKSEWAERLATQSGQAVTYVATASIPATWRTVHALTDLAQTIHQAGAADCLLVDSLGTWVANLLDRSTSEWEDLTDELLEVLKISVASVILVGEETGWGVVPAFASGRLFRDRLGMLTRRVGSIADSVYLVTGGHVLNLSQLGHKLDRGESTAI
jgi:adenosylcobinamide kinase / adenosylcobinamide-phosphate guanylyltransferase